MKRSRKMQIDRERFERMCALYREWNDKINVISRKDIDQVYEHHVLHSLAIAAYFEREGLDPGRTILDVGTGGGFPGMPLALVFPQVQFTLCDSIGKKIRVASAVAEALGLENVRCVNARAETLPGQYDWIVSRAVASLQDFYPWVKDKYRQGILCLKGGDLSEEIAVLERRFHVGVRSWRIDSWLNDDYYAEKFVIQIGKNYLCTPKSEK